MRSILTALFILGFSAVSAAAGPFAYNARKGKCLDASGRVGLNRLEDTNLLAPADIVEVDSAGNITNVVFQDRSGECADLSNVDIDALIRKPEYGYGYLTLQNWNLNGARMNGTHLSFSVGTASVLGADLTGLLAGYVMMTFSYDKYTTGLNTVWCPRIKGGGTRQCDTRY